MKSPIYILTALLPLLAVANPDADADADPKAFEALEDRQGGGKQGGPKGGNPCRIERPFEYYKYPCDNAQRNGRSRRGDTFQSQCRYRNWYKTGNDKWVRDSDKPRGCRGNDNRC